MTLLSDLATILQPVALDLAQEFGSGRVTVYRAVSTESSTGRPVYTYPTPDATLSNVACFLVANTSDAAAQVGAPQAVRPTGSTDDQAMRLYIPPHNGVLPVLNAYDGIKVLSGPYAGYTYVCVTDSAPDTAGIMTGVTVLSAPPGAIT